MEVSNLIKKRLVNARDVIKAREIIKCKYKNCRIITYQMKNRIVDVPLDKRKKEWNNRQMWVWFITDINEIKKII